MFGPLGAFINSLVVSAQTSMAIPIVGLALLIGGGTWALGNAMGGKGWITGGLIGGAVMLLAVTLASGMSTISSAVPKP